jgi:uncharacterized membrane protein
VVRKMKTPETERMINLTDGVFAIVMTLLVLELSIPLIARSYAEIALAQRLLRMWPKYLSYVVSFIILGLFWAYHNTVFDYIKRSDSRLFWLNMSFLMFVALIPFSASLLAEYWQQQIAVVLYGLTVIVPFAIVLSAFLYAVSGGRLSDGLIDPALVKRERLSGLLIIAVFAVAIILSFTRPIVSLVLYGLVPLFFIMSSLFGREGLSAQRLGEKPSAGTEA